MKIVKNLIESMKSLAVLVAMIIVQMLLVWFGIWVWCLQHPTAPWWTFFFD